MIALSNVFKSYGAGAPALANLTLQVAKGEFVFVTGPSGAGKSTLLRLIGSAEAPDRGELRVGGQDVSRLRARAVPLMRRRIGVVFQDFKLLPDRSVAENVAVSLEVRGVRRVQVARRTYQMLGRVGLAHRQHQLAGRLSGGEQQRVAIARALVHDPLILLADEPTGNLDRERAAEIMALLAEANARGTTVLVATHDDAWVTRGGRRVLALREGKLA